MGTGKFVTVYPGVWTEREKPYAEEYFAKIKELEDRGPIDVQALISGKIEKGTQGFSNVLEVKEDMMLYNAKKYDLTISFTPMMRMQNLWAMPGRLPCQLLLP